MLVETLAKSTSEVSIETILVLSNVEGCIGGTFKPTKSGDADSEKGDLRHLFIPYFKCLIHSQPTSLIILHVFNPIS